MNGFTRKIRLTACLLSVIVMMLILSGCFGKQKLIDSYDEDEIVEQSEMIINEVHINGVEAVLNKYMREDYLKKYPMDEIAKDFDNMRKSKGNFMDYTQTTVIGKESPDEEDVQLAACAITATYEEGELLFMLTFDPDMQLVGFYIKS